MNTKSLELISKIDVKKTAMYVGGVMLLIVLFLVARRMIRKAKAEKRDEDYLNLVEENIDVPNLTYTDVEYHTLANSLEQHFNDTGLSGGWYGVNQRGVYDIMEKMKSDADIHKLIDVYGVRPAKDISFAGPLFAGLVKEKDYKLPDAMTALLTNGERRNVNDILEKNGLTFSF